MGANSWLGMSVDLQTLTENAQYASLSKYLHTLTKVFCSELGYESHAAEKRSIESLKSTIEALLCTKRITVKTIRNQRKKVVTTGGCTEKGIGLIAQVSDLFCYQKLLAAIKPVYRKTKKFDKEAIRSINSFRKVG